MFNFRFFSCCFLFLWSAFFVVGCQNSKNSSDYIEYASKKNTQDMPRSSVDRNPLAGLSTFTFYSFSPVNYDKINAELQKYAVVNKVNFLEETSQGVEFNKISFDPLITFEVKEVCSIDGATLPFIRASLSVESRVIVEKTQKKCESYIWTKNCFVPGDAYGKHGQELVVKSLDFLLELFVKDYLEVNSGQPTFDFVDPKA